MSGIGGIYNFDCSPVDKDVLMALGRGLVTHGPDGGGETRSDSVGMVYRAFHTNRKSRQENQPFVSKAGHILCWDGRLDNREELIAMLRDKLRGDHTDVAIVMACYLKWGCRFPSHIIGDFAFALWDPNSRTLILVRDPIGTRLLYYHKDGRKIIWSTDLESLLDLAGIELAINEEYIADFIGRIPEPGDTPYRKISAVLPAHVVSAKDGQILIQRYWGLNPNTEIRYKTDREYEEHFLHLFREAVTCRLRTDGPAWAELSGGLDSSAIVCMGHEIIQRGEAQASRLETVSRVFDEASESDERKYIQTVEEKIGKNGVYLCEDQYRIASAHEEKYSATIPNPIACAAEYYKALEAVMQMTGARVLLSGHGGDEILNSLRDPSPELADLLFDGKLFTLHQRLRTWSEALKKPYLSLLWQNAVIPTLPKSLQALQNREFKRRLFKLYRRKFVKRLHLFERRFYYPNVFGFRRPGGRDQSTSFLRAVSLLSAGYYRQLTKVEITYPFTHRPLIEFTQAIPFDQKVRPWESRSILRRALREILPKEIANRRDKGRIADAYLRAMTRELPRLRQLFADARLCRRGYVRQDGLMELLDFAREGDNPRALYMAYLIPLEYWLRSLEFRENLRPANSAANQFLGTTRANKSEINCLQKVADAGG